MRGCLGVVLALGLVVAGGYAGWRWGDRVFPHLEELLGISAGDAAPERTVGPALGASVLDRIEALSRPDPPPRIVLNGAEVTSAIRYGPAAFLPDEVSGLEVEFEGSRIVARARVPREVAQRFEGAEEIVGMLPDTLAVEVEGRIEPLAEGRVAFVVEGASALRIPIPERYIPRVLEALGRDPEDGMAPNAYPIPLPPGATGATIEEGHLVLRSGA